MLGRENFFGFEKGDLPTGGWFYFKEYSGFWALVFFIGCLGGLEWMV